MWLIFTSLEANSSSWYKPLFTLTEHWLVRGKVILFHPLHLCRWARYDPAHLTAQGSPRAPHKTSLWQLQACPSHTDSENPPKWKPINKRTQVRGLCLLSPWRYWRGGSKWQKFWDWNGGEGAKQRQQGSRPLQGRRQKVSGAPSCPSRGLSFSCVKPLPLISL